MKCTCGFSIGHPLVKKCTCKPLELTDDEIKILWNPMPDTKTYESDILKFARAVLEYAQKK